MNASLLFGAGGAALLAFGLAFVNAAPGNTPQLLGYTIGFFIVFLIPAVLLGFVVFSGVRINIIDALLNMIVKGVPAVFDAVMRFSILPERTETLNKLHHRCVWYRGGICERKEVDFGEKGEKCEVDLDYIDRCCWFDMQLQQEGRMQGLIGT